MAVDTHTTEITIAVDKHKHTQLRAYSQLTHTHTTETVITVDKHTHTTKTAILVDTHNWDHNRNWQTRLRPKSKLSHTHKHNWDSNCSWNTHKTGIKIAVDTHTYTIEITITFLCYTNLCDKHRNWHYTLNDFGFSWPKTLLWHKRNEGNTYLWRSKQLTSTETRLISLWSCWKRIHRQ